MLRLLADEYLLYTKTRNGHWNNRQPPKENECALAAALIVLSCFVTG
jgi:hypothetical protein